MDAQAREQQLEAELLQINAKLARAKKKANGPAGGASPGPSQGTGIKKKKAGVAAGGVPNYLKGTASMSRKFEPEDRRNAAPNPEAARADHIKKWNAPPEKVPGETWGGPKRRGQSTASVAGAKEDPEPASTTPRRKERTNTGQSAWSSAGDDKERGAPSPTTTGRGAPELGTARVRGMQHKVEPPMPDPEADLARVLCMVQLPCTPVALAQVRSSCDRDRFKSLLESLMPGERRLPPPSGPLTIPSINHEM